MIWKPDLTLQNGFTKIKELGDDFLLSHILNTGQVYWRPYEIFETKCKIDIKYFPFDRQTCTIEFGSWMTNLADVDVEVGPNGFILDDYSESDEWALISTSAHEVDDTDGAKVILSIVVRRLPNYYILNIVLPVSILSILTVFTFAIPADSGEKIQYSMTVFLSFSVFLTIVTSSLPVTSATSYMSVYLLFLLVVGAAVVMIAGLEMRLHHRDHTVVRVPHIACKFVRLSYRMQCQNCCCKMPCRNNGCCKSKNAIKNGTIVAEASQATTYVHTEEAISWPEVVSAIDFFLFYSFLFLILIITVVLFAVPFATAAG